jgi:hypothetical protein
MAPAVGGVVGRRCRMHGGHSPGAPIGNAFALKTGLHTRNAIAERRKFSELLKGARAVAASVRKSQNV